MKRIALLLAIAACASKPAAPVAKTYTMYQSSADKSAPVVVTLAVPPDWKEELDKMGTPTFTAPDAEAPFGTMFVLAIHCPDAAADDQACGDAAVKLQFGDGAERPFKTEKGAGATSWVIDDADVKGHKEIHLRRFFPNAKTHTVVMCGALLASADVKFAPDVRKACDTLVVK